MSAAVAAKIHEKFSQYPCRVYPKGQILVFADENPEHVFYLTDGRVRKYDVSYRGEELIVNMYKEGSFFPMSWAVNRTPNHFFYKTETPATIHVVPADDALQFLQDNTDVMMDLLSRLYRGMDGLLGRMVHLMASNAKSRLMYELVVECHRFGQLQPDGTHTLSITEVDLAARSGLSRETVSRELRKLKNRGWIAIAKTTIAVHNVTELEAVLGGEV